LDVFFDWKTFRGTQSSWKELAYFERPQDKPYAEGRDVIQGACAWGSICSRVPAGAGACKVVPEQIVTTGPCGYTRNPMYLGHLIFMIGLSLTFWSWFALILLADRTVWFHRRVLLDEQRLEARFGANYAAYRRQVKRWIPGMV
jgi:protein-S-isoprenylcysteine O-methyltransferase Ste14